MSLTLAQANAWSLATTLMVCVVLIATTDGYSVLPATEFDGDPAAVVHEYDPFAA
jgi:hypothetical protein